MKKFRNIGNPIYSSIAVVVFIIVWEIFTRAKNIKEYILPAPSAILNEFITSGDLLLHHSMVTMTETVLGFILGLVLAILLSLLMSSFKLFRSIFYPFMFLSQTIPIIVVAPLITVWFGFGLVSKLIVCVLVVFFPIALNLTEGLSSYDKDLEELLMCMNASKFQIFMKLKLPSALVHFFSGLKIAAAYAVMGAIMSEWTGAESGLGIFLTRSMKSFRTAAMFADIAIISIFSILLFGLIKLIEKRCIKWNVKG
ncbi:ABC-type nitrate/sulfonate/bicarbonate transport system permease component [Acetivibrio thermocellus AD2]|jgi:putative hydroxymethylpyrimidine transport system permease protein|uniref:ABC-type nitrate/sulfonate/bicarbonate transport system permease component n=1 Tax=Acetivibrio thermocellus AD2 TaxID=1138384 RepID=A0AB36TJX1_ACETH|nr:ABC transporter permease [Acetivibrio thermocellus]CDG36618.1 binding-protein-dependent transport systems inner membrane component [Acetivibrio thermocellus BC1]ADU75758.1 binding-protein-dependent transport systems inner membrane component [Acetivibrio thermocellus DSM 1313]ALX09788.1 ABC-type transporter, integral membrane subunit [Acetivibrio thermocellus AD2]ANV77562.1 ABC-type transporter, integral membrane subunit [Acetivibrio thermocellus DSM 2360]EIC03698.1 ABC-type transporter, int